MSIRAEKFEREELASYMAISTTTNQAILCPTLTVIKSTVTFFQMKMNARLSSLVEVHRERASSKQDNCVIRTSYHKDYQFS